MNWKGRLPIRYEVGTYLGLGTEPEVRSMSEAEVDAIDLQAYDHVMWPSRNLLAFRTADGQWVQSPFECVGMGEETIAVLESLALNAGTFLDCREIATLTGNENYCDANALAARIRCIRKVHHECAREQRFLVTRRRGGYAAMWPAELKWLSIKRIP